MLRICIVVAYMPSLWRAPPISGYCAKNVAHLDWSIYMRGPRMHPPKGVSQIPGPADGGEFNCTSAIETEPPSSRPVGATRAEARKSQLATTTLTMGANEIYMAFAVATKGQMAYIHPCRAIVRRNRLVDVMLRSVPRRIRPMREEPQRIQPFRSVEFTQGKIRRDPKDPRSDVARKIRGLESHWLNSEAIVVVGHSSLGDWMTLGPSILPRRSMRVPFELPHGDWI